MFDAQSLQRLPALIGRLQLQFVLARFELQLLHLRAVLRQRILPTLPALLQPRERRMRRGRAGHRRTQFGQFALQPGLLLQGFFQFGQALVKRL